MKLKKAFLDVFGCYFGGESFHEMEVEYVKAVGVKKSKAFQVLFDAKVKELSDVSGIPFNCASMFFDHFQPYFAGKKQEELHAVYLDNKHRIIESKLISLGTINQTIVHPREFFKRGIELSCAAVIALHNHPSGDPYPSQQDHDISKRLNKCGEILGIRFLDSIIIGSESFYSFVDQGLMP